MTTLRGTNDIGLRVKWRYEFVRHGEVKHTLPDTVFLSVGNSLEAGVLDYHQDGRLAGSAAKLVLRRPDLVYDHLLGRWLDHYRSGANFAGRIWEPIIVTHEAPDFDGIVAAYLITKLIKNGGFPVWAESLAEYAALVHQGRYRISLSKPHTYKNPVHLAVLADQHLNAATPDGRARMRTGFRLLQAEIKALFDDQGTVRNNTTRTRCGAKEVWLTEHEKIGWRNDSQFSKLKRHLDEDIVRWITEVFQIDDSPHQRFELVKLPVKNARSSSEHVEVWARVLTRPSNCCLFEYWSRVPLPMPGQSEPCETPLLITPRHTGERSLSGVAPQAQHESEAYYPLVFITLDPTWHDHGKAPTLRGLGRALEREEHRWRDKRGPGGDERTGPPRFVDDCCRHDDPWYDGRGHDYTVVDVPRGNGTWIPYERVWQLATHPEQWRRQVSGRLTILRTQVNPTTGDSPSKGSAPQELSPHFSGVLRRFFDKACVEEVDRTEQEPQDARQRLAYAPETTRIEPQEARRWVWYDGAIPVAVTECGYTFDCWDVVSLGRQIRRLLQESCHIVLSITPMSEKMRQDELVDLLYKNPLPEEAMNEHLAGPFVVNSHAFLTLEKSNHDDLVVARRHLAVLHGSMTVFQSDVLEETTKTKTMQRDKTGRLADRLKRFGATYQNRAVSNFPPLQEAWNRAAERLQLPEMFDKLVNDTSWLDDLRLRMAQERTGLVLAILAALQVPIVLYTIDSTQDNPNWLTIYKAPLSATIFAVFLFAYLLFRLAPFTGKTKPQPETEVPDRPKDVPTSKQKESRGDALGATPMTANPASG